MKNRIESGENMSYVICILVTILVVSIQVLERDKVKPIVPAGFLVLVVVSCVGRLIDQDQYEGNLIFIWHIFMVLDGIVWLVYVLKRKSASR